MYLFACINGHRVDVFLCYDTGSNLWSEPVVTGIMPPADIHGHSICVVNDAIYTFGGFGRRYVSLYGKEVYKLDLKSLKWSHITTTVKQAFSYFCSNTFISRLSRDNHRCFVLDIRPRQSRTPCSFMGDVEMEY